MVTVPRALSLATLMLPALIVSCGGGTPYIPPNYTLTVSPQPASVEVGTSVTFTATTNAPSVTWGIVGVGIDTTSGTPITGSGTTYVYTAPATPPTGAGPGPQTPGTVTIRVIPGFGSTSTVNLTFTITAPSITTGFFTTSSTSVALGTTQDLSAYAVGSTNNALTMQVNGTTGGSASVGTITPLPNGFYGEYVYTAPATMPMTGSTITITVVSQADPTKSSNLTLTLH